MPTAPGLGVVVVASGYPPAALGGLERGCERLARSMAARGLRVTVLTCANPAAEPVAAHREPGEPVVHRVIRPVTGGPAWGASYIAQTAWWLWRLRARWDVAFCQQLYLHSVAATLVARLLGKASASLLVASDSYSDIDRLRAMRGGPWLLRTALAADAQFVLSERSRAELRAAGLSDDRILPYRYFVDTAEFAPDPVRQVRTDTFVFVGRFDRQKNLPLLVEAFERAHARAPGIRLRLVGRGPDEDRLRSRIDASPASGRIVVEPWTDEPVATYRDALAVVSGSDAEGLSNVMIEALACGAPVVTTDVSGARDALGDDGTWPERLAHGDFLVGRGGIIVNLGDAEGLGNAMIRVHDDADLRSRLSSEARARACAAYAEPVCVEECIGHLRHLVEARRSRRRHAEPSGR